MSRIIVPFGRYALSVLFIALLSIPGFAQQSIREALDFDGDTKSDFTIFRPSENAWYILGSSGSFQYHNWGLATEDRLVPGDYDGDDKADVAVWRDADGVWYVINSSTNTFNFVQWGTNGDEPVARDYDGDGKTDQAIVRRTGGYMYWYILQSNGGINVTQWGLDIDFVAPGDYDGDLKFDLAVQRPGATPTSQAFFYILTATGFIGVPWGWGSDFIVPGDYDGDGKTDVAVVREGSLPTDNLVWFIIKSSDPSQFIIESFGLTGDDLNTQGYYDNDNKTDISVWRNSEGLFYVLQSSNGAVTGAHWGSPNDMPLASYDTH